MKKISLCLLALCLVACADNNTDKNENKKKAYCDDVNVSSCELEKNADMSAYENFMDESNQFISSSMESVLSIIEKKQDAVVYFGFPKCPWCVEALPILNEVAKEKKKNILYVETRDKDKNSIITEDEKAKIMEVSDAYLKTDEEGNKKFYVPFVISIKKGVVVSGHVGTVDGYDTDERKMNAKEKDELKEIYNGIFKD